MMRLQYVKSAVAGALALGLSLFAADGAWAQAAQTQVSQTATMLNAATTGIMAGGISTNAQVTATVPAVGSQYFYLTAIEVQSCQNATGAAIPLVQWTTTNLPGSPTITSDAAAAPSTCADKQINFTTPLRSLVPGTAVTLVSPTGIANVAFAAYVAGYYAY